MVTHGLRQSIICVSFLLGPLFRPLVWPLVWPLV